jgi:hypothetical protein
MHSVGRCIELAAKLVHSGAMMIDSVSRSVGSLGKCPDSGSKLIDSAAETIDSVARSMGLQGGAGRLAAKSASGI